LDTPPQLAALRTGELDLGVVRSADPATGVTLFNPYAEPMMLALPTGHRLAEKPLLTSTDLRDEAFVLWRRDQPALPRPGPRVLPGRRVRSHHRNGGCRYRDPSWLGQRRNRCLTATGIVFNLSRRGMTFKALRDAPESVVQLAWVKNAPPVPLEDAIAAARETTASLPMVRLIKH
jgi:LysR substrate binding domain